MEITSKELLKIAEEMHKETLEFYSKWEKLDNDMANVKVIDAEESQEDLEKFVSILDKCTELINKIA